MADDIKKQLAAMVTGLEDAKKEVDRRATALKDLREMLTPKRAKSATPRKRRTKAEIDAESKAE